MSIKDDLQKHYGTAGTEQKLVVLRHELLRPIVTIQSSANLLIQAGDQITNCLPEAISPTEFKNTVKWLAETARDVQEILGALIIDRSKIQPQRGSE